MAKSIFHNLWFLASLVVLSVIAINGLIPLDISGGFSTLSVSQVNYQSNDPTIGGPAWLLTVSQNGAGQYITGTVTADQLQDTSTGAKAANNVDIKMTLQDMYVQYPIQSQLGDGQFIYHIERVVATGFASCPTSFQGAATGYKVFGILGDNKYCFKYTKTAAYGLISTPTTVFKTDVSLTSGGKTATATISNIGEQTVKIVDPTNSKNVGTITWVGNLVTGEEAPRSTDQGVSAAYVYSANGWKTISESDYQYQKTWRITNFQICMNQMNSESSGDYCVTTMNNLEGKTLVGKNMVSSGGSVATTQGTQSDGQVTLQLKKQVQFPLMTMRLSSEWIGTVSIVAPVGKPQIISVSSVEFQTGGTGFITLTVKNIGDGDGSFAVSTTCDGAVSVQGASFTLPTLKPSEVGTYYIPLSGNTLSTTTSQCSVKVYDRNNPDNSDVKTVVVTVKQIVLCSANDKRSNGATIEQCNPDGSGWKTIQVCASDETPQRTLTGDIQCVKKKVESPNWNPFGFIGDWLNGLVSGLVGSFATFGFITMILIVVVAGVYFMSRRARGKVI